MCYAMIAPEDNLQGSVGDLDMTMLFQNPAKRFCARTLDYFVHVFRIGEWLVAGCRQRRHRGSRGISRFQGGWRGLNNWLLFVYSVSDGRHFGNVPTRGPSEASFQVLESRHHGRQRAERRQ